jgi:protein-S-isoprenylcysteine O-methyltransferase Ste14
MAMDALRICVYLWVAFLVVWFLWAIKTKPVQTREGVSSRLSYTVLTIAGAYTMFGGESPRAWLHIEIFPASLWIQVLAILITAAGIGFAIWARAYLGGNWSSAVTVKVGHQLVQTGPYRWVRHPIYTGIILGLLGTAMAQHKLGGLVAVALFYLGFKIKSKIEERTMVGTFGPQYEDYRRSTGAILPRLHF